MSITDGDEAVDGAAAADAATLGGETGEASSYS